MGDRREDEDLAPLKSLCQRDIDAIAPMIIKGKLMRHARYFTAGNLEGDPGGSLVIWRSPSAHAGNWRDYNADGVIGRDRGDVFHLIAECMFAGDVGRAIRWAKDRYGWTDDPEIRRKAEEEGRRIAEASQKEASDFIVAQRKKAKARWLDASPQLLGTAADDYLLARAIDLRALTRTDAKGVTSVHTPGALRFKPDLVYWEVRDSRSNRPVFKEFHKGPAILAAIQNVEGKHVATHRIWTGIKIDDERDPTGDAVPYVVARGPDKATRKAEGLYRGGFIRVWVPDKRRPLKKCGPGDIIGIAEGVEDCLSGAVTRPNWHWVSAVSLSNLVNIDLPCAPGATIVMCKDNDWNNPQAGAQFRAACDRLIDQGFDVREFTPSVGKDLNDQLRGME